MTNILPTPKDLTIVRADQPTSDEALREEADLALGYYLCHALNRDMRSQTEISSVELLAVGIESVAEVLDALDPDEGDHDEGDEDEGDDDEGDEGPTDVVLLRITDRLGQVWSVVAYLVDDLGAFLEDREAAKVDQAVTRHVTELERAQSERDDAQADLAAAEEQLAQERKARSAPSGSKAPAKGSTTDHDPGEPMGSPAPQTNVAMIAMVTKRLANGDYEDDAERDALADELERLQATAPDPDNKGN